MKQSRSDEGWPRAIDMGMGAIIMARNKKEYDTLAKVSVLLHLTAIPGAVLLVFLMYFIRRLGGTV